LGTYRKNCREKILPRSNLELKQNLTDQEILTQVQKSEVGGKEHSVEGAMFSVLLIKAVNFGAKTVA